MSELDINQIPEIFRYTEIKTPEDCIHKIGPSQIGKFFEYPVLYYDENIRGNIASFQGNTSTTLGSICHWIYKCVTNKEEINREIINKQLHDFNTLKPELELDIIHIENTYPLISSVVVNEYLIPSNDKNSLIKSEQQVLVKIDDGVYLGGTYDRLESDCVVDFKTVGKLPDQNKISFNYKIQLLAYAYALRLMGHVINRIRIVYGVAPTKTIPARCVVVTEEINFDSEKLINDTLKLIAESVIICHNKPELIHLIFKSMNLKQ